MESEIINTTKSIFDKGKLFLKSVVIFFMALGLWIPSYFISETIKERKSRQQEAIQDISSKWAASQVVKGPLLQLPYFENEKNDKGIIVANKKMAYFLADRADIQAEMLPEKRHRGIYEVVVYDSKINITGNFNKVNWQELDIPKEDILWDEAALVFGVSDNIKGINEDVFVNWNNNKLRFEPLPDADKYIGEALIASLPLNSETADVAQNFNIQFMLKGSEKLLFAASAYENKIDIKSSWPDPSFTGVKIPDLRKVSDSGFTASWKYMNRAVPKVWKDKFYNLGDASFGADLIVSVDSYDKTERSVKYALLCIILTFASFFLIESIYKKPLHLVQYGLVGLALVLFYTLLLSISEYLGFNLAYLIAGVATIALVAWFVGSIMKSSKLAIFISFVLTIVYGYIFSIIQLQDYALLMGSIGLFIALAIIMYFSRKLQW